jgi:hypothetical protein
LASTFDAELEPSQSRRASISIRMVFCQPIAIIVLCIALLKVSQPGIAIFQLNQIDKAEVLYGYFGSCPVVPTELKELGMKQPGIAGITWL